ncbi:hypothetical protein EIN_525210 [Entamoeba invadens IP1]|uniref:GRIP domain-containing protein n=1 Tax=Entamoeba invadens IP1 TaxID=370355 RepID=A0A0A1U8W5_ENTIV|nr:hypothetical protein EIN_525210 [Entamoeba invadens IP1]ELP89566.1 hypothetical protein EIN_525210 [Entamoeba invadens IP1]|eukprot:XP_004256337.1 hypothetical protein EIN_525210 [Entamoeba invadens IP1]
MSDGELCNELKKQQDEVKRLKLLILKQEDSQTEIVSSYEEQIEKLKSDISLIPKQTEQIKTLTLQVAQLQETISKQTTDIQNKQRIIQTLSGIGRKMKEEQDTIFKEKMDVLNEELVASQKATVDAQNVNKALNKQIDEFKKTVLELEELKTTNAQRNETITKLYEENETLKKAVEHFTQDMQSRIMNESFYVDKRIVNKLLISYITKPHQRTEIVELMSKIMDFTQEEKQVLGVAKETESKGIFSYFFGKTDEYEQAPKYDIKDKTFGDLWVEFLLRESGSLDSGTSHQVEQSQQQDLKDIKEMKEVKEITEEQEPKDSQPIPQ